MYVFKKNICKEKKTAVLICGHLRTYRFTLHALKKYLINRIPADIFVSTWSTEDTKDSTWWRSRISRVKKTRRNEIYKSYAPKAILIQTQKKIRKYPIDKFLKHPSGSLLSSTKSVLDCFELAKKHGNYERFVVVRPDLKLFSNIRKDEINDYNNNYFCRHDYFTKRGKISDVWWICGDKYFETLKEYREKEIIKILNSNKPIPHQEDILSDFLAKRKVPVKLSKTKWGLQRNQNVTQVWAQENKKVLAIPFYIKILNRIVSPIEISDDKIVIKFGRKKFLQGRSKKYNSPKRAHKKIFLGTRFHRFFLPRFSAGKFYFKITFLRP